MNIFAESTPKVASSNEFACLRCTKDGEVYLSPEDIQKIAALTAKMVFLNLKQVKKDERLVL